MAASAMCGGHGNMVVGIIHTHAENNQKSTREKGHPAQGPQHNVVRLTTHLMRIMCVHASAAAHVAIFFFFLILFFHVPHNMENVSKQFGATDSNNHPSCRSDICGTQTCCIYIRMYICTPNTAMHCRKTLIFVT